MQLAVLQNFLPGYTLVAVLRFRGALGTEVVQLGVAEKRAHQAVNPVAPFALVLFHVEQLGLVRAVVLHRLLLERYVVTFQGTPGARHQHGRAPVLGTGVFNFEVYSQHYLQAQLLVHDEVPSKQIRQTDVFVTFLALGFAVAFGSSVHVVQVSGRKVHAIVLAAARVVLRPQQLVPSLEDALVLNAFVLHHLESEVHFVVYYSFHRGLGSEGSHVFHEVNSQLPDVFDEDAEARVFLVDYLASGAQEEEHLDTSTNCLKLELNCVQRPRVRVFL